MFTELKTRLEWWWATRTIKEGEDFICRPASHYPDTPPDTFLVEVMTGKYKGVVMRFGNIYMREDEILDFDTQVLYNPESASVETKRFVRYASNVMRIMLHVAVREAEKILDESRTTDTTEPHEERAFHEEDTSLLEARVSKRKSRKKVVSGDGTIHPEIQQPTKPKRTKTPAKRKKQPNRV
jgi:hypothetical protein